MTKTTLSPKLVAALQCWAIVSTPTTLYHGCRSKDHGVDLDRHLLTGSRWFSNNAHYAGEYAWFHTDLGVPLRVSIELSGPLDAVQCPANLRGVPFVEFLHACFPDVQPGYGLSRHFQGVLGAHLEHIFHGSVRAYTSHENQEVLIPECERWISSSVFQSLPPTKLQYVTSSAMPIDL